MDQGKRYLDGGVLAEPLVDHWYAWPLLISPASAAMIAKNLHLPLLASFVKDPQLHTNAAANPNLRGGPFINHQDSFQVIEEFRAAFTENSADLLELAAAIDTLATILAEKATGGSLRDIYPQVPEALRGCVELVYDLQHHPSARFIESLLYKSKYYDRKRQTINLISQPPGTPRSFVLSTPRFENDHSVILNLPFDDPMLADLLMSKSEGIDSSRLGVIADTCGLHGKRRNKFMALFGDQVPEPVATAFDGHGVRVRYFGHATLLIQSAQIAILTDPLISYDAGVGQLPRYSYRDLPDVIDYVVLTHNHQDHVVFESLLQIRHRIVQIVIPRNSGGALQDPSLRLALENTGFHNIVELDEMQTLPLPGGHILGLPFLGEHGDLNIRTKLAYSINLEGINVICAADSNNLEPSLYDRLSRVVGKVDALFIGMECVGAPLSWLYGPLYTTPIERRNDQARRLDGSGFEAASAVVASLRPAAVYVYAMGAEPWLEYISSTNYNELSPPIVESDRLIEKCRRDNVTCERLFGMHEFLLQPNT